MTAPEGPIAALADEEAWYARERYPDLLGAGMAEYFWARELESGGWELCEYGGSWPQQARDSLGSHFRLNAQGAGKEGDANAQRRWNAAALRMDREVVDEVSVLGERFRIVRAAHFIRSGPAGPEPPRPTDPDPAEVGDGHRVPSRTKGFVVDPLTGTGMSDGILKLDLLPMAPVLKDAPDEMNDEARAAIHRYPGGVLLPAAFVISARVNGRWGFHQPGSIYSTPQGARDSLAFWLRVMGPFRQRMPEEQKAEYAAAADRLDEKRSNVVTIDGHRFRITRVERLVRIGPDGPELPRPSDYDPEVPVEVQTRQLREDGVVDADGNDLRPERPDPRADELRRLWQKEEARRVAWRAARRRARGADPAADPAPAPAQAPDPTPAPDSAPGRGRP
ncbi:DUF5954 family protein [Streptomyces sp. NRRL F-5123]|uniref:DUF5954 family protein n=1 Tax=Streptomyces sp. NRRL F-5123 TaxID=1463856 RepID=UPI002D21844E|nr:DUF5954 family protein [Streptomyces sp. NRRL F-5123]